MKEAINCPHVAPAIGPYSHAVKVGKTVYLSGQIALTDKGQLKMDSLEEEVAQIMSNIETILKYCGGWLDNIVKVSIFLTDMKNFEAVNKVYGSYFSSDFPARETVQVSGLPKGVNVEISVIAVLK